MKSKLISVFTPTYNRAKLLYKCYNSLCRQTSKNFVWIVVDDGSTDNTKELVQTWQQKDNGFDIIYKYKENGGLHTGYNAAIELLETELALCVDSDDYLKDDAIEIIANCWKNSDNNKYAGIITPDCTEDGKIIGDLLPNVYSVNIIDLLVGKYNIDNGDRLMVVRSDLYKSVAPQKVFLNEKNFNPHYMHLKIGLKYEFVVLNKALKVVDYQAGGMSDSMLKQYISSPNSFLEIRKLYLSFPNTPIKFRIKNSVHMASSCILLGDVKRAVTENPNKILSILSLPIGFILTCYIKWKTK